MVKLMKKVVLAGLGVAANARETFDELVRRGEENQGDTAKRVKDCLASLEKDLKALEKKERDFIERVMAKLPVATKADLERLEQKIQELVGKTKKA